MGVGLGPGGVGDRRVPKEAVLRQEARQKRTRERKRRTKSLSRFRLTSATAVRRNTGVSGSKESRPELNRLTADGHKRAFDAVLVWKIDRYGRSLKHLVNALADLSAYGVAFVSFRDNLDLSTPSGRLMFQIIGAMAEFERSLIQERVRAGLRNARAKGKKFGRPRVKIDAIRVAELRRDGLSCSQVCRTLNVSKGSAQRSVATIA